jgi:hypothetical protein
MRRAWPALVPARVETENFFTFFGSSTCCPSHPNLLLTTSVYSSWIFLCPPPRDSFRNLCGVTLIAIQRKHILLLHLVLKRHLHRNHYHLTTLPPRHTGNLIFPTTSEQCVAPESSRDLRIQASVIRFASVSERHPPSVG